MCIRLKSPCYVYLIKFDQYTNLEIQTISHLPLISMIKSLFQSLNAFSSTTQKDIYIIFHQNALIVANEIIIIIIIIIIQNKVDKYVVPSQKKVMLEYKTLLAKMAKAYVKL